MFRRKKDDEPMTPGTTGSSPSPEPSSSFPRTATQPTPTSTFGASGIPKPAATAPTPPRSLTPMSGAKPAENTQKTDEKKLTVGPEIVLSGQITSCDRLVVEGRVEASLTDSRAIEIADTGFFKGTAEIDSAVIGGRFEGTLTVRERLTVKSTGRIQGKIRYGQIEIEPGGEISGEVQVAGRGQASLKPVGENKPAGSGSPSFGSEQPKLA
jgi:cytoskeletal protein CcmA (bactofilin family)